MNRALSIYPYVAPVILAPASFLLWQREYNGNPRLVAATWLVPILWAYIVPAIGTNVLHVWEFDTRLRLGHFRPHHGFVFGSATSMLAWLVHTGPARTAWDVAQSAFILCCVLGFCNFLYDVKALQAGVLHVYNQPWADGKGATEIALDYAPWFFGGFGAVYGAGLGTMEILDARGWTPLESLVALTTMLALTLTVPVAGYVWQSQRRHGHWGTRPVQRMEE